MKIIVVDDHPLILEALHHVLKQLDGDVEVLDAQDADSARLLVAANPDASLLLLDLGLPGSDGFSLLDEFRSDHPALPVVVLSASDRRSDVIRAIDTGAMGFIPKSSPKDVMLQAMRLVLSGGVYLPQAALAQSLNSSPPEHVTTAVPRETVTARQLGLTDRQAQVLALILQGKPNKVICRELGLAEGTVKIHVAAILRAFNVSTRTQAVIEASRLGLRLESTLVRPAFLPPTKH